MISKDARGTMKTVHGVVGMSACGEEFPCRKVVGSITP